MSGTTPSRIGWRTYADVAAAAVCAAAAVWIVAGGQNVWGLSSVDLGFHELGHLVFAWTPGLIPVLAGSFMQVAVPLGLAIYFARRREPYASALMLAWAATSTAAVSVYVADAPFQSLTLLGNGVHDWAWVFGSIGHMEWAVPFGAGVRWFAVALAALGFLVSVVPLLTPHARERAEDRRRAALAAREAELRAKAPRRDPHNLPPKPREQAPPPAPAGRF